MNYFKKMKMYTDEKYVGTAVFADTFSLRLRGMIGRYFSDFSAMVLTPCSQIHTFGMEYPIDVIYIDRENHVLRIDHSVPPGRIVRKERNAISVIEFKEMDLFSVDISVGSTISFKPFCS